MRATLPIWMEVTTAQKLAVCKDQLTKWQLFDALTAHGAKLLSINGIECLLVNISREDGSGSSFNLIIHRDGRDFKCYCRTKD